LTDKTSAKGEPNRGRGFGFPMLKGRMRWLWETVAKAQFDF